MCSYFGITILPFFMKIENANLAKTAQFCTLINRLIFDIINIQNNQSLEFEQKLMLTPLRSATDQMFSWFRHVFFKSF